MQDREIVLAKAFEQSWPLIRIHAWDPLKELCSCNNPTCKTPAKHPKDKHGIHSARAYKSPQEMGQCNVGLATGNIVVVDIDPRNGGGATLAKLEQQHGKLPHTWSVETGGRGKHYYFSAGDKHIRSFKIPGGIDVQGHGSYVIMPSSVHVSGKEYEWLVEPEHCELAPLPEWITSLVPPAESRVSSAVEPEKYNIDDVKACLEKIPAECDYETWRSIGMAIHSAGLGFDYWHTWSQTADSYPGEAEMLKKWNSFRGKGVGIGTLFKLGKEHGWQGEEIPLLFVKKPPVKEVLPITMKGQTETKHNIYELSSGIVREIADVLLNNAYREYPNWAVASALAVLSTVFQQYVLPPIKNHSISLFQIVPGFAAQGKDAYLFGAKSLIEQIDYRFNMASSGSSAGLIGELYTWNSKFEAIDEFQDVLGKLTKTDNPHIKEKLTNYKLLFGKAENISVGATKQQGSIKVFNPKLSMLCFGTPNEIAEIMSANNVNGGLISRFMQWPLEKSTHGKFEINDKKLSDETVNYLRSIIAKSLNPNETVDKYKDREKSFRTKDGTVPPHVSPFHLPTTIGVEANAIDDMLAFHRSCDGYYVEHDNQPDGAPVDRSYSVALRIATIHACGRKSLTINKDDFNFGKAVATLCRSEICASIDKMNENSPLFKDISKVVEFLKLTSGTNTEREVQRKLHCDKKQVDLVLQNIESLGYAVRHGGKFVTLT